MTDNSPLVNGGPKGGKKWMVTTVVLFAVVILLLAVYPAQNLLHSSAPAASSVSASPAVATGQEFNVTVNSPSQFSSITMYFGDGSVATQAYSGSNSATFNHVYSMPGEAYLYYVIKYTGGATYTSSGKLIQVSVNPDSTYLSPQESLGSIVYNTSSSSLPAVGGQSIFTPGSFVNITVGFYNEPQNHSYQVVSQVAELSNGNQFNITYAWDSSSGVYKATGSSVNYTFGKEGLYVMTVYTYTAAVNTTTGQYTASDQQVSSAFYDFAIFKNGAISSSASGSTFVRDRLETGGYNTLDGAIAYDGISLEILDNVYQTLVMYNGSSSSQFKPMLASALPTQANGMINSNTKNYTETYVNGTGSKVTYTVHLQPYENYTFQIRNNATWQNGNPVTAWDVMYSITRDLLFNSASPTTPGWILSQYLLPGNFGASNTFYNITQNVTVDNSSNTITFHFQEPLAPDLVFEILSSYGTYIMSSQWLIKHNAGITWNATGFQKYKSEGSISDYNQYVQNHVMANGPYSIAYVVPASEVVLQANPYFSSPGPWYPKPSVGTVKINYIGSLSSLYLELKSGSAQSGDIPTSSWNLATQLNATGKYSLYTFPTLSISFYNYNANINTTLLQKVYKGANVPYDLFASHNVRKAFAYAFNYRNFLNYQVGNKIYNSSLAIEYAGLLPKGMVGYQSISDLNNTTTGVPYYDLSLAAHYWSLVDLSKFGISNGTNGLIYKGQGLVIPIFVSKSDPIDLAGAETFSNALSSIVKGASFPIVQVSIPQSIGYIQAGGNPMPLYMLEGTWGPDYPFPTDYLGPIGIPGSGSFYAGGDGYSPSYFNSIGETQQAQTMQSMISLYNNATLTANTTKAMAMFHQLNEMVVNMTLFIYTYQSNGFWIMSSNVNHAQVMNYQENVMRGGDGALLYNFLSYTS